MNKITSTHSKQKKSQIFTDGHPLKDAVDREGHDDDETSDGGQELLLFGFCVQRRFSYFLFCLFGVSRWRNFWRFRVVVVHVAVTVSIAGNCWIFKLFGRINWKFQLLFARVFIPLTSFRSAALIREIVAEIVLQRMILNFLFIFCYNETLSINTNILLYDNCW